MRKPTKLWSYNGNGAVFAKHFTKEDQLLVSGDFKPRQGDALLLHGGADIWPGLYGERVLPQTTAKTLSARDSIEHKLCQMAITEGIPIIGICRGAQMLCIMAGGSLWQHVNHHTTDHVIEDNAGKVMMTPQAHHQMMRVFNTQFTPLAWVPHASKVSDVFLADTNIHPVHDYDEWELEAVYFDAIKGLAFQPHPEWAHSNGKCVEFRKWCDDQVDTYKDV